MKSFRIKFKYADEMSGFEWRNQECHMYGRDEFEAVDKCIEWYGLFESGVQYKILEVIAED